MIPNASATPHVPDTSLLSDSEKMAPVAPVAPVAADAIDKAVQGAHKAVDRIADSAAPSVRHLAQTGDAWTTSLRGTVREQPLMALLAAFAVGALVGRITR